MFRLHAWQSYPFQSGLEVVFTCSFVFYGASSLPPPPPTTPPESSTFCFTSAEARWLIRDGDRGGGGGEQKSRGQTGETVDRRQNNGSVKAVSPRHCPATSAPRNCCFNCRAWAESQLGQCPLHRCWGTTRSERSSTFAAQLHLPTRDLFWANLRSSSTSLLLISWSFDLTRNLEQNLQWVKPI